MAGRASADEPHSLQFTEEMKGWFCVGETDFVRGEKKGRASGSSLMFHLTITTDDVRRFVDDRDHTAGARGWIRSDVLGGRLTVERGLFNLFVTEARGARRMLYRLYFANAQDEPLTLSGFKDIHGGSLTQVWPETSTLYTSLLNGHVDDSVEDAAAVVGRGILHILPLDFARQLTTFRVGGEGFLGRMRAFAAFGQLFFGQLWEVFSKRRRPALPGP